MDLMEKVERLRQKTGVSYTDARQALEQSGGDLLEALCWLEQQGRVTEGGAYSTTEGREAPEPEAAAGEAPQEPNGFQQGVRSLWDGLSELFRAGNRNQLVMVDRHGVERLGVPVTAAVILTLAFFWAVAVLVIVALFFGNRFCFRGPELGKANINDAMSKATDFAEQIKDEFTEKK